MLRRKLDDPEREIQIQDEIAKGAKYVIDGPLRRVPPYYYTYLTFTKQRWQNRTLVDVFTTEFRDKEKSYYESAIKQGKVQVNSKIAAIDYKLKDGDLIEHRTHKHEQPVSSRPISIVYEDDDLVVIDKPSGVPAHPTGRFKFNSVVSILKYEHKLECHPCNRLDRLTSGLMFLAKNPKMAEKIGQQIRDREVTKLYYARVKGEFPLGDVTCEEPVATVNPKVALNMIVGPDDPRGKEAKTQFRRISFDGETSIVECRPFTGRTHQIRVHLQYMGYPIANDPVYSNPDIWGPDLGKGGHRDEKEIAGELDKIGKSKPAKSWINSAQGEVLSGKNCEECSSPLYTDPGPNDLDLWLHAVKYSANDGSWAFETGLPAWITEVHMPFMDQALREADKCEPLDSAFCVGAVLVHNGKIIETGYTRELPGNTHAEQCALTKYREAHNEDVPEGTVLYTTMEPCSYRLSGNLPCVDRVLDSPIKTVFVGVVEPGDFVENNTGRAKLEEAGVRYIHLAGRENEALRIAKKGHKQNS